MKTYFSHPLVLKVGRFLIGGTAATTLYLSILTPLTEIVLWRYWLSAIIAFIPSLILSFEIQRRWVFRNSDPRTKRRQLSWFTLKQILFFFAGIWIVDYAASYFQMWYWPFQVGYIGLSTALSYLVSSFLIFTEEPPPSNS